MCAYNVYVLFVIAFFSFFAPLGPLCLIIVRNFPKKCGNTTMPRSDKNTAEREHGLESDLGKSPVVLLGVFPQVLLCTPLPSS